MDFTFLKLSILLYLNSFMALDFNIVLNSKLAFHKIPDFQVFLGFKVLRQDQIFWKNGKMQSFWFASSKRYYFWQK